MVGISLQLQNFYVCLRVLGVLSKGARYFLLRRFCSWGQKTVVTFGHLFPIAKGRADSPKTPFPHLSLLTGTLLQPAALQQGTRQTVDAVSLRPHRGWDGVLPAHGWASEPLVLCFYFQRVPISFWKSRFSQERCYLALSWRLKNLGVCSALVSAGGRLGPPHLCCNLLTGSSTGAAKTAPKLVWHLLSHLRLCCLNWKNQWFT